MKKIKFDPKGYRVFVKKDTNENYAIKLENASIDKKWEDVNCELEFQLIDSKGNLTELRKLLNSNDLSEVWIRL